MRRWIVSLCDIIRRLFQAAPSADEPAVKVAATAEAIARRQGAAASLALSAAAPRAHAAVPHPAASRTAAAQTAVDPQKAAPLKGAAQAQSSTSQAAASKTAGASMAVKTDAQRLAFPFAATSKPASPTAGSLQFAELFRGPAPAASRPPLSAPVVPPTVPAGAPAGGNRQDQTMTTALAAARSTDRARTASSQAAGRTGAGAASAPLRQPAAENAAADAGSRARVTMASSGDIGTALDRLIAEALKVWDGQGFVFIREICIGAMLSVKAAHMQAICWQVLKFTYKCSLSCQVGQPPFLSH